MYCNQQKRQEDDSIILRNEKAKKVVVVGIPSSSVARRSWNRRLDMPRSHLISAHHSPWPPFTNDVTCFAALSFCAKLNSEISFPTPG